MHPVRWCNKSLISVQASKSEKKSRKQPPWICSVYTCIYRSLAVYEIWYHSIVCVRYNQVQTMYILWSTHIWITYLSVSLLFFSRSVLFTPGLSSFVPVTNKCYIFLDFGLFFSRNLVLAPDFGLWFPFYVPIRNRSERQNLSVPNYNSADFFDGAWRRCPEAMQSEKPAKRLV